MDSGDVRDLKAEDINLCNHYQFDFKNPDNLYNEDDLSSDENNIEESEEESEEEGSEEEESEEEESENE